MEEHIGNTFIEFPFSYLGTILIFAITSAIIQHFISYYREKGKNLATKQDISEITDAVKSVEHGFNEKLERLKAGLNLSNNIQLKFIDAQKTIIEEIFITIELCIRNIEHIYMSINESNEKINKAIETAKNSIDDFYTKESLFKIYISKGHESQINEKLEELNDSINGSFKDVNDLCKKIISINNNLQLAINESNYDKIRNLCDKKNDLTNKDYSTVFQNKNFTSLKYNKIKFENYCYDFLNEIHNSLSGIKPEA